ncbi:thioredoxin family protein [Halocynthiibacter sp. C4]|uniref:thioredoxin family protein n=1 Tax=Halocynthiibacter sp. C4 TaxID=2992758 RepID=UPI00237B1156|nr:thioredoxin family protein [Halocynthiibacter sp. C4]MDE0590880.1 thioredoxin family protein [Halocynthiibacter sp. C4]
MKRRDFIAGAILAVSLPFAAISGETVEYKPGLVDEALAEGKTVFVDFGTDWCTTCAAQKRAVEALRDENPAYDDAITFVYVNWDQYSKDALSKRLKIPRRSVLVALRGDTEIGRVTLGTSKKEIKALLDAALASS